MILGGIFSAPRVIGRDDFEDVSDPQNTKTPRIWRVLVERISFLSSDLDKSAHNKSYSISPKEKKLRSLKG